MQSLVEARETRRVPRRRALRIACIGPRGIPSNYGGIERACEALYPLLAARGHTVTVYCRPSHGSTSSDSYRGVRLIRTPALTQRAMETVSHAATSLIHALLYERFDVVHLHALAPGLLAGLCRLRGIPTVATVHGLDWQRAKWTGAGSHVLRFAERSIVRHVDEIIVVSRDLRKYFQTRYHRATHYIANGADHVDDILPCDSGLLSRFGLRPGFVLYVGRLVPEKRIDDLIRAFRVLPDSTQLAIVGSSQQAQAYGATLQRLAQGHRRIVFTGGQDASAVRALFKAAAVSVLPSDLEGLPLALLECLNHGTPAIATDIPPHREVLDNIPGYDLFYPPGDIDALAARLRQVLGNQHEYRELARRGQTYVREHYRWDAIAEQTEEVFYQAVRHRMARLGAVSTSQA